MLRLKRKREVGYKCEFFTEIKRYGWLVLEYDECFFGAFAIFNQLITEKYILRYKYSMFGLKPKLLTCKNPLTIKQGDILVAGLLKMILMPFKVK